jgi:hypothetical protein
MRASRNRLSLAVAGLVVLSAAPSLGQSLAVPCSAFARDAHGGWKVLAPVMLEIDGRLRGPMVGTTLKPGTATNGITMSEVLDRECPGVHFDIAARHGMGRAARFQSKRQVRAIVARGEPAHGKRLAQP